MIFLLLALIPKGFSQVEIPEFSHVIVPEQFDFLLGKDTYQLNSLTKFLLNKNGFNAVFENELETINRCEVLWADVLVKNGVVYTKAEVIFKNCLGVEVVRSPEGKSKNKEYKKAYQEAIRKAMDGFTASSLVIIPAEVALVTLPKMVDKPDMPVTQQVPVAAEKIDILPEVPPTIVTDITVSSIPTAEKTYSFEAYKIIDKANTIVMQYQNKKIGSFLPTSNPGVYLVRTSQFYGVAYKTATGFTIEREIEGLQQLVEMKFE